MKARILTRQQIYGKVFIETGHIANGQVHVVTGYLINGELVTKAVYEAELAAGAAAVKTLLNAGYVHHYDPNA